jgi:hypothetical protein
VISGLTEETELEIKNKIYRNRTLKPDRVTI